MWLRQQHLDARAKKQVINYISPEKQVNAGLWSLFLGATVLLALRLWVKFTRRHGVWWDDYILVASWCVLAANNSLISYEYATGYVTQNGAKWDDRMHILINITSCGTLIGQAWTKSAFAVTLLKLTERWQQYILWFCIASMNLYMVAKCFLQWGKLCDEPSYDVWYRMDFCVSKKFRDDFKEGGNVYNIIMDYFLAAFPWYLTWKLPMRRAEKVGLCLAMSLGVIVATVAAVRTAWKDEGNKRDPLYYWRNGLSNVWYSSEVAGTIIVQCIPVLRPFLRDVHYSITSRRIHSSAGPSAPFPHDPGRKTFTWAVSNQTSAKQISLISGSTGSGSNSTRNSTQVNGFNFGFNETKITAGDGNHSVYANQKDGYGPIELRTIEEERELERRDEEKSIRSKLNGY